MLGVFQSMRMLVAFSVSRQVARFSSATSKTKATQQHVTARPSRVQHEFVRASQILKDADQNFDEHDNQSDLGASRRRQGVEFEARTARALANYGFILKARAAAGTVRADHGIDLDGTWTFAPDLVVAAQCKSIAKSIPVSTIRELESSVKQMALDSRKGESLGIMGMLASATNLSPAAKRWFEQSQVGLCLAIIRDDRPLCEFAMNPALSRLVPGIEVVRQFDRVYGSFLDVFIKR